MKALIFFYTAEKNNQVKFKIWQLKYNNLNLIIVQFGLLTEFN